MSQTPIRRLDAREPEFQSTLDAPLLAFEAEADGASTPRSPRSSQASKRTTGDAAVVEYTRRFDGLTSPWSRLELPKERAGQAARSTACARAARGADHRRRPRARVYHERQKGESGNSPRPTAPAWGRRSRRSTASDSTCRAGALYP